MHADLGTDPVPRESGMAVFRPEVGRPGAEEPLIPPLVAASARRTRRLAVWLPPFVAFVFLPLFLGGEDVLLLVAQVIFTAVLLAVWYSFLKVTPRARRRLLQSPVREIVLGDGDLLETRYALWMRLAGEAGDRWYALRPGGVVRDFLATERRLFVLGPDDSGRALVHLPGYVAPLIVRTRREPARGAKPVAALPRRFGAPKDDRILRTYVRHQQVTGLAFSVTLLLLLSWLTLSSLSGPAAVNTPSGWWLIAMDLVALLALVRFMARLARFGKASHAITWTPLAVTFDVALPRGKRIVSLSCRVLLPDGKQRKARLFMTTVDLAAAAYLSGQLWVIGAPQQGNLLIGLPGFPGTGLAKLGRLA
ncbi:hypothetical protein ORV05_01105 [Amycolatopsis cynarae]|uniref:PH domain-containing protein n=1 Tax=Amycolatopsis cynarae TaxID=2995223 RepID=A0ABY7B2C4_9PSEU|nr:hypothetical protein [Amycolatopsis sp. HUAS 11-8]WAL66452.1 hypothetical protein ORV05_01105 [Amycolatopsis sp. HUAS 11-8]